jgi:hypothetical protein
MPSPPMTPIMCVIAAPETRNRPPRWTVDQRTSEVGVRYWMMITATIDAGAAGMAAIGASVARGVMARKCPPSPRVPSIGIGDAVP